VTQQIINVGSAISDGTGDPARTAFTKSNDNFTELYARGTVVAPQGRLTLVSATPVMTTTQTAKTTIYYTPYVGNQVPIYDGTNMTMTTFAELSVATTDTTKNPAAIGASKVNDWFVWNDAGTLRLSHGPDWTSDSARSAGTAFVMVNGIYLNAVAITNACAASRGTYVGTTRSGGGSTLAFVFPGAAVGGTAGFFGVWNAYNRVLSGGVCTEQTASWTTGSTTPRSKANSGSNSISFVSGLLEDVATFINTHGLTTTATDSTVIIAGIGIDSNTFTSTAAQGSSTASNNNCISPVSHVAMSLGYHTWYAVESTNGPTNVTSYGGLGGPPARSLSTITFSFPM